MNTTRGQIRESFTTSLASNHLHITFSQLSSPFTHSRFLPVALSYLQQAESITFASKPTVLTPKFIVDPSKHTVEIARQVPHGSSEGIPLIPLDAVAGFPAESGGGVRLEDCERYVIPEFENKGANFLIRVSGDSMVPLYYSGDLLACRKITDIRFFQWGTVYVLETSQGVLVKRVQESIDHADSILCVSENSSVHHPFLLPRDDIRSLSIIVGLVRLV